LERGADVARRSSGDGDQLQPTYRDCGMPVVGVPNLRGQAARPPTRDRRRTHSAARAPGGPGARRGVARGTPIARVLPATAAAAEPGGMTTGRPKAPPDLRWEGG